MSMLREIQSEYKRNSLLTIKALNLPLTENDLGYFVNRVKANKSIAIRRVSKDLAIHLVYLNAERYYVSYNNRYELISAFLSEAEARINRYDKVIVWNNGTSTEGTVVFIVKAYADPRSYLDIFRKRNYDVSEIAESRGSNRPQYSYLVLVKDSDEGSKIIWPPSSSLRKIT